MFLSYYYYYTGLMLDAGYSILDVGCLMLDTRSWMLDAGCSILDPGCSIRDKHLGKFVIEDRGSSIEHLLGHR
jgi:hypothetical protein